MSWVLSVETKRCIWLICVLAPNSEKFNMSENSVFSYLPLPLLSSHYVLLLLPAVPWLLIYPASYSEGQPCFCFKTFNVCPLTSGQKLTPCCVTHVLSASQLNSLSQYPSPSWAFTFRSTGLIVLCPWPLLIIFLLSGILASILFQVLSDTFWFSSSKS